MGVGMRCLLIVAVVMKLCLRCIYNHTMKNRMDEWVDGLIDRQGSVS